MNSFNTKTLEGEASNGRKKYWKGIAFLDEHGKAWTQSETWQVGSDGKDSKHMFSEPVEAKPKNVGKKNETSPWDQALAEINSDYNKKKDKGYVEPGEVREGAPLPMLAHPLEKGSRKLEYPVLVQPKFDGVRCITDGKTFWSRQGKEFPSECIKHLRFELPKNQSALNFVVDDKFFLDGELMLPHDQYTFQETIEAVKKFRPLVSPNLQFFVYDMVSDAPYSTRLHDITEIFDSKLLPENYRKVVTAQAGDEKEIHYLHDLFVQDGYEGAIVRARDLDYTPGHRNRKLLKVKEFKDEEFEITGSYEGVGKDAGCPTFICKAANGKTFHARPKGTYQYRRQLWQIRESLIGKMLTVRYQALTDDGIPRFPIGIAIRDYE